MGKGNGAKAHDIEQSTINLRVLRAASIFASKEETRYYICGVCLEIDERGTTYVCTDGHRLIAWRDDIAHDEPDNSLTGVFIVPTDHCRVHKLEKDDLGIAKATVDQYDRLTIAYKMTDITFHPIDGTYPHWRRALPQGPATGELAQFNLKLAADFDKFAKEMSLPSPTIWPSGNSPAWIWFSGFPHIVGCIMPFRAFDEMERNAPQWARRGGPAREQADIEDPLFTEPPHDPVTGEVIDPPQSAAAA